MIIKLWRFKQYLATIESLKAKVDRLECARDEEYCRLEERISRADGRARAVEREAANREQQEESDRWYREDQLRTATRELERAISYEDCYAARRATDKLKRLSL